MSIRIIDRKNFEKRPHPSDHESAKNIPAKKDRTNQKANSIKFSAKPWGFEYLCFRDRHFDIWELRINPQSSTSSHIHAKKDSLMIMIQGETILATTDEKIPLKTGDFRLSKRGTTHQIINAGSKIARILEIESPPDRNDLIRIGDIYGRKGLSYASGHPQSTNEKTDIPSKKFFQEMPKRNNHFDFFELIPSPKKQKNLQIFGIVCHKEVCSQDAKDFNLLQRHMTENSLRSFLILQGNISLKNARSRAITRKRGDCFVLTDASEMIRFSRNAILIGWR